MHQSLTWVVILEKDGDLMPLEATSLTVPRFRKLRNLKTSDRGNLPAVGIDFLPASWWDALLDAPLVVLILDTLAPLLEECLSKRGHIRTLKTFAMSSSGRGNSALDFLAANKQISKFSLKLSPSSDVLERQILPMLEYSLLNLRSLSLLWEDTRTYIPESTLASISRIRGLEQVHLSVGIEFHSGCSWRIDHKAMRKHLRSLTHLRKLAFSWDTYPSKEHPEVSAEDRNFNYHEFRLAIPDELAAANISSATCSSPMEQGMKMVALWERIHRQEVVEAMQYLSVIPRLDWMYFGQHPMGLAKSEEGKVVFVPLCEKRSGCQPLFRWVFSWEGCD